MFVTLEEAKGYLRVDSSDEDELILRLMETSDRLILDVTRQPRKNSKSMNLLSVLQNCMLLPTCMSIGKKQIIRQ